MSLAEAPRPAALRREPPLRPALRPSPTAATAPRAPAGRPARQHRRCRGLQRDGRHRRDVFRRVRPGDRHRRNVRRPRRHAADAGRRFAAARDAVVPARARARTRNGSCSAPACKRRRSWRCRSPPGSSARRQRRGSLSPRRSTGRPARRPARRGTPGSKRSSPSGVRANFFACRARISQTCTLARLRRRRHRPAARQGERLAAGGVRRASSSSARAAGFSRPGFSAGRASPRAASTSRGRCRFGSVLRHQRRRRHAARALSARRADGRADLRAVLHAVHAGPRAAELLQLHGADRHRLSRQGDRPAAVGPRRPLCRCAAAAVDRRHVDRAGRRAVARGRSVRAICDTLRVHVASWTFDMPFSARWPIWA